MLKTYEKRDKFKSTVKAKTYGAGISMAPNEFNLKSQANMTPERAAWLIRMYMIPLKNKHGRKIIGPSAANGPSAIAWYVVDSLDVVRTVADALHLYKYKELRKIAPDVDNSFTAHNLHYYGLDPALVIKWMQDWHNEFGKDIWLTEYGCWVSAVVLELGDEKANLYL